MILKLWSWSKFPLVAEKAPFSTICAQQHDRHHTKAVYYPSLNELVRKWIWIKLSQIRNSFRIVKWANFRAPTFPFLHGNKSDHGVAMLSSSVRLFLMRWQLFSLRTFQMWTSFLFPRRDFTSIIWTHLLRFIALSSAVRSPRRLPLYWGTRPEHFGICGILSILLLCSDNCLIPSTCEMV